MSVRDTPAAIDVVQSDFEDQSLRAIAQRFRDLDSRAAGRFGGFFHACEVVKRHFVALHAPNCCYANKSVASGIWYT
jgi:hypothetical protein